MEEKLRNLSQNIENNTGANAHKPEETPPEEHHEEEHHDEPREEEHHEEEHHEEEISDYTPEPEEQSESDKPDESDDSREAIKEDSQIFEEDHEGERSSDSSSAKILTMDEDEPQESPTRMKKYSPEVEAALNRLNSEESSIDYNTEPLSTEPKKKHHGGQIFLAFLLILAIAAATLCILVEQNIIDNPLNLINGKKSESSQQEPVKPSEQPVAPTTTEPVELTNSTLIAAIDAIFEKNVKTDNYYVFSRTSQTLSGKDYVYYDVAEAPAVDCAEAVTDCVVAKITADDYEKYPAYRYTFVATDFEVYEFQDRAPLESAKTVQEVSEKLNTTENK
ncbi:hypothetical protein IKE86_02505 [Candidatus Saccharibacteria bacterium]|nr:hypothetical protein [Candidatus Saccharibacteria bacterium]